ncbi:MAG: LD-carboxypeptidase [Verrucomicrobiales bacterium]|nr:LD-carboxypeptidase [Verrucomicrobiales bacterium]
MTPRPPPRLRRGDVIGLVAPASPPARHEIVERSVRYLEGLGYRVEVARHLESRHGFSAGTDDQRASDVNAMFANPHVAALFAIRGGNGCCRLLKRLDYDRIRRHPKILVGYSDLTFLQLALWRKTGLITFSGPMPGVEFWSNPDPFTEEAFWDLLTSCRARRTLPHPEDMAPTIFRKGSAEGRLLGGCFSLVVSVLGTPFQPDFHHALLFVEDVREELHRIHRMFSQLDNAGILEHLAGMVVGQFTQANPEPKEPHLSLDQILAETLADFRGPVLTNLAYGHIPRKMTLPQGVRARLDASRGRLTLLESPVS